MTNTIKIGNRIQELRKQKDMSRDDLAFKISISTNYHGKVERRENYIAFDKLIAITRVFDMSLDEFFSVADPTIQNKTEPLVEIMRLLDGNPSMKECVCGSSRKQFIIKELN